jgi:hypothetical protein
MVADTHLRSLVTLCDADQREARPPEIVMPRSDSDSDLTRTRTRDSVDRDSWTEEAGFHAPNRLFLSFDVWLDPTTCSELPEPNGLRKELEQLYMQVSFQSLKDVTRQLINYPLPFFHRFQEKDARRQERKHRRARRVNARPSTEYTSRALIPEREQPGEKQPQMSRSQLQVLQPLICSTVLTLFFRTWVPVTNTEEVTVHGPMKAHAILAPIMPSLALTLRAQTRVMNLTNERTDLCRVLTYM